MTEEDRKGVRCALGLFAIIALALFILTQVLAIHFSNRSNPDNLSVTETSHASFSHPRRSRHVFRRGRPAG